MLFLLRAFFLLLAQDVLSQCLFLIHRCHCCTLKLYQWLSSYPYCSWDLTFFFSSILEPRFHGDQDHWALALEMHLFLRECSYLNENDQEWPHFISKGIPLSFLWQDGQPACPNCANSADPFFLMSSTYFRLGCFMLMSVKKHLFLYWR